ncbi:MAG: AAA family ATPase, partial [Cyanobacteria bacterium]|nr:AAA family ATPase [Cyanobacteriota bacterium]
GTGKTTVARILANVYREIGILKKGRVADVKCADLISGTTSKNAAKIREVVSSNRGNLLFIDDAHLLVRDSEDAQGLEYVDALIRAMDDHRDAVIVVLAGNKNKMEEFISTNPGLKSRFTRSFLFEDYSAEQMAQIYETFCSRAAFRTSPSALRLVKQFFEQLYSTRGASFGNVREVRHVFESIIGNQANRIIGLPHVNEEILSTITDEDVLPFISAIDKPGQTVRMRHI